MGQTLFIVTAINLDDKGKTTGNPMTQHIWFNTTLNEQDTLRNSYKDPSNVFLKTTTDIFVTGGLK